MKGIYVKSRFIRKRGEVVEKVLSCFKCNTERSKNKNN